MPESSVPAEFAGLPAQELAARLAAALGLVRRLRGVVESKDLQMSQAEARHAWELAERDRRIDELTDRLAQSQRKASRDSSNSSKPPSSDSPFERDKRTERGKDRSLRKKSGLPPGKQHGDSSTTLRLTDEPNETILCPPTVCGCCAGDLSDASVEAEQRRQVREIAPPPPPRTIEYRVQAKVCAACGATNVGTAPAHAKARASYGPDTHAQVILSLRSDHGCDLGGRVEDTVVDAAAGCL